LLSTRTASFHPYTASHRTAITVGEVNVLIAACAFGRTPDYTTWRQDHLDDEHAQHALKNYGLLQSDSGLCPRQDTQGGPLPSPRHRWMIIDNTRFRFADQRDTPIRPVRPG
jgi:hypothetical protein